MLGWYVIPRVIWGNLNNLMDNFQLVFCLAGILFFFKFLTTKNQYFLLGVGFLCFIGVLAKGPVALYLWSIPIIFYLFFKETTNLRAVFHQTKSILAVSMAAFLSLILSSAAARNFLDQYWTQRLSAVLSGTRADSSLSGFAKFEILQTLSIELAPMAGLWLIFYFFDQLITPKTDLPSANFSSKNNRNMAAFFVVLGLAGSVPIVLSAKQSGIYLLPSLPLFALGWAFLSRTFVEKMQENGLLLAKIRPFIVFLTLGILIAACVEIVTIFGKPGREKALLGDLDFLQKSILPGSQACVCPTTMSDFTMHTYLQRFAKIELTMNPDAPFFLLENKRATCQPSEIWAEMAEKGTVFRVFQKK